MALSFVSSVLEVVLLMTKLVLAAMVTENGNVEGVVVQVQSIVHYVEVRDISSGNTLVVHVDKLE
jgi:hypothetical protein